MLSHLVSGGGVVILGLAAAGKARRKPPAA
jgi:hypothetical protein